MRGWDLKTKGVSQTTLQADGAAVPSPIKKHDYHVERRARGSGRQ